MREPAALFFLLILLLAGVSAAQKKPAVAKASSPSADRIQKLLESGQAAEAEAAARKWVTRQPESAPGWNLLGVALIQQQKLEEAESAFTKSAKLDPKALIPRQNLARLYLSRGQKQQALSQLKAAQQLGALDEDLALFYARELLASGDKSTAIELLGPVAQHGESVQAMLMLAGLEFEGGEAHKAASILEKALVKAPNSEEVLYRFAQSTLASGAPTKALFALMSVTRMNSHFADYFYLLGVAWMQIGEMAEAIPALTRATELEPNKALPYVGLGLAMNNERNYAGAKAALEQALTLEPENKEAMAAMAEALDGLGQSEKAQELAQTVTQRDANNLTANVVLGTVLMNKGQLQESLAALKRAESSDPGSSKVQYLLSRIYSRLNQPQEAKRHLEMYQQAQKDFEEKLKQLRGVKSSGGMKP